MNTQDVIVANDKAAVIVLRPTALDWLNGLRREYNQRYGNDLSLTEVIESAIHHEIWRMAREMGMSEDQVFRVGVPAGQVV